MAIDGGLRKLFHQRLGHPHHWQAVETGGTGRGIPDSNVAIADVGELWMEWKACAHSVVGLRPEQVAWISRRTRAGGRCLIGVRRQLQQATARRAAMDELWLVPGRYVLSLHEGGLAWAASALSVDGDSVLYDGPRVWRGGPARWDWDEITEMMVREARRAP